MCGACRGYGVGRRGATWSAGELAMRRAAAGRGTCAVAAVAAAFAWGLAPAPAAAASFNCKARGLSPSDIAICRDPQLSRADEQTVRRIDGFARRLNLGQYAGLRLWHSAQLRQRDRCGAEIACLGASYRVEMRFLDRLQQCLDAGQRRRSCLRDTINSERDARDDDGALNLSRNR
jgi:uncharacterized protein